MPKPSLCHSQKGLGLALAVFVPWPPSPLGFASVKFPWLNTRPMVLSLFCSHASTHTKCQLTVLSDFKCLVQKAKKKKKKV